MNKHNTSNFEAATEGYNRSLWGLSLAELQAMVREDTENWESYNERGYHSFEHAQDLRNFLEWQYIERLDGQSEADIAQWYAADIARYNAPLIPDSQEA